MSKHELDQQPRCGICGLEHAACFCIPEKVFQDSYAEQRHLEMKLDAKPPYIDLLQIFEEKGVIRQPEEVKKELTEVTNEKGSGLRFNQGKTRFDLIPAHAMEQVAKVFTKGAEKYAERNWEKGMNWSKVTASLKRHLEAFERSEDFDKETGLHHMAHVATNALFLLQYYKIFPQGDDRPHPYLSMPKIGLDIDEILCDWVGGWQQHFGKHNLVDDAPAFWNFDYATGERFKSMSKEAIEDLYINLPTKIKPEDIPFEPHCYITSRSVPVELTKQWLQKNGFACAPVYSVGFGVSKVEVAKESGIDIFVDDRFDNFVELNNAGICTYLWDASHNQRYDVGYKRIKSLSELLMP